jgi:hypothetical protein
MHVKGQHAIALARQGFKVFPLCEDDPKKDPSEIKRPALSGDWKRLATSDRQQIMKWWSQRNYNIGVASLPGSDDIFLDYDMKEGQLGAKALRAHDACGLPTGRFRVKTPTGGLHVYLKAPKGVTVPNSVSKISPNCDVRGNRKGGYVVGPGSTIHNIPYEIVDGSPTDIECPQFIIDKAGGGDRRKSSAKRDEVLGELDTEATIGRVTAYLINDAPEATENAGGNQQTFDIACVVRDMGLSEPFAFNLMAEHWNPDKAHPSWSLEELQTIVGNAYRYAENPIGYRNPQAEFEAVIIPDDHPGNTKPKNALYRVLYDEGADGAISYMGEPLIEDLLDVGGMSAVYGKSGSGKTFNALDIAFHIAAGRPWYGDRASKQGLVIYVAAEGGKGIFKRLAALRKHYGVSAIPLDVVPCPVNLLETGKASDTAKLMALIREAEAAHGQKCVLLVIDTLSRALAGGDENSSQDMGNFIRHIDRMRAELATHLMVVHHAGKDIGRGARGWSGIQAALDTEIEIHEGKLTVTKQRDIDPIEPIAFRLRSVAVGVRARDAKPITSCVVEYYVKTEFDVELSDLEKKVLKAIREIAAAKATSDGPVIVGMAEIGVHKDVCVLGLSKQHLGNTVHNLVHKGAIQKGERGQYVVE